MSEERTDERPPPTRYEITWTNGHVEYVLAHQVIWPSAVAALFGGNPGPPRVLFHADIDGVWTLQLSAREEDIRTVRNAATEAGQLGEAGSEATPKDLRTESSDG